MLPSLKQLQHSQIKYITSRTNSKVISLVQSRTTVQLLHIFQQKYQSQQKLNHKLKQLLNNIRSNMCTNISMHEQQDQIKKLIKQRKKQQTDVQHQAHILNLLISQNQKLKKQVNSERNKRVIYFNVYKNLEHQIHHWEVKYKSLLIESLRTQGTITKIKQKFRKATKKAQKQIKSIKQQLQQISQKQNPIIDPIKLKTKRSQKQRRRSPSTKLLNQKIPIQFTETTKRQQKLIQLSCQKPQKWPEHQLQYQLQQKDLYVQGIINRIKQISKMNDLHWAYKVFKGIDESIQHQYGLFKQQEKRQKQLIQKIEAYELQLGNIQSENYQTKSTVINRINGQNQLMEALNKLKQLEMKLQQKIGVKVNEISNEIILHHCLRVRDQKKQNKRNLQRYLQQTKKQKPQQTILLSPDQMHRKIVQGQANFI